MHRSEPGVFVREGLGETYREELHQDDADPRVWGDEAFLAEALGASPTHGPAPPLDTIIAAVCASWDTDEAALRSSGRQCKPAQARAAVGWLAIQMRGAALNEIAVHFGRDTATMSRQVGRLAADARRDRALAARLAGLRRRLE